MVKKNGKSLLLVDIKKFTLSIWTPTSYLYKNCCNNIHRDLPSLSG